MSSLYSLDRSALTFLILVLSISLLYQGYTAAYDFFRWQYDRHSFWNGLADAVILCQLGGMLYVTAQIAASPGLIAAGSFPVLRLIFFGLLAAVCLGRAWCLRRPSALVPIPAAALTLPVVELAAGRSYPVLLMGTVVFWVLRAAWCLGNYQRERREKLSAFSVKEAVDTMNFGILFYRAEGEGEGQILLTNRRMQVLMHALIGRTLYSGKEFWERLKSGAVQPQCRARGPAPNILYALEDGSVWRFDLESLSEGENSYCLLLASDMTRYSWTLEQLRAQGRELQQRNLELKNMLRNLEGLCRTEETLRVKSRVHDLLGQQISLILRAVREHREPEDSLLEALQQGLPSQLKETAGGCIHSLRMAAESFRSLGVEVTIQGEFPGSAELQNLFFEISAEAMTNAVHHGYATRIQICSEHRQARWELRIRDNGRAAPGPVTEGGGLRGMRRKTEELGGQFSYSTGTHFSILVTVPEGESI